MSNKVISKYEIVYENSDNSILYIAMILPG